MPGRTYGMIELTIYSRPGCHLCDDMKRTVERVVDKTGAAARIREINVESDPDLEARYGIEVPVLVVNERKVAKFRVTDEAVARIVGGSIRP
jgi:thiol-disulfide isomerase/thioredoxin